MKLTRWPDLGCVVVWQPSTHAASFRIYDLLEEDSRFERFVALVNDTDTIENLDKRLRESDDCEELDDFSGFVKWDGCGHFYMPYRHVCGFRDAIGFCDILKRVFYQARDFVEAWSDETAETPENIARMILEPRVKPGEHA